MAQVEGDPPSSSAPPNMGNGYQDWIASFHAYYGQGTQVPPANPGTQIGQNGSQTGQSGQTVQPGHTGQPTQVGQPGQVGGQAGSIVQGVGQIGGQPPPQGYYQQPAASQQQPHPYMWGGQMMPPPPYGAPPHPYAPMYPPMYPHPNMPPGYPPQQYGMQMANPQMQVPAPNQEEARSSHDIPDRDMRSVNMPAGRLPMNPTKPPSPSDNDTFSRSRDEDDDLDTKSNNGNSNAGTDYWPHQSSFPAMGSNGPTTSQVNSHAMVTHEGVPQGQVVSSDPWNQVRHMDDREVKKQRRKQSNRESARRSRLRKQAECEDLNVRVEELYKENCGLREELVQLKEQCAKIEKENNLMEERLKESCS